ncbi:hypothetical protein [Nocardia sp. NBC_01329]|uniref:hypothetical protein n=1 Tax=Nocardia sp. NBC_01329 TaxID=2903594 RepID=UPI002E11D44B|nr:hypothetical protein OG405_03480 [Nocardia sp. NBC_01329]
MALRETTAHRVAPVDPLSSPVIGWSPRGNIETLACGVIVGESARSKVGETGT